MTVRASLMVAAILLAHPIAQAAKPKPSGANQKSEAVSRGSLREAVASLLYSEEAHKKAQASVEAIVANLTRAGDPTFYVTLSYRLDQADIKVESGRTGYSLSIDPGALVYADNLSEFAAVIAYKLASVRTASEARWAELRKIHNFPEEPAAFEIWLKTNLEEARAPGSKSRYLRAALEEIRDLHQ
ncbi:MAG: hypothetical protein AAB425_09130, partial [Bdellovibrionota bacterium]